MVSRILSATCKLSKQIDLELAVVSQISHLYHGFIRLLLVKGDRSKVRETFTGFPLLGMEIVTHGVHNKGSLSPFTSCFSCLPPTPGPVYELLTQWGCILLGRHWWYS